MANNASEVAVNFKDFEKDINDFIVSSREASLKNISEKVADTVKKEKQQTERSTEMSARFGSKQFRELAIEIAEKYDGQSITPEKIAAESKVTSDVKIIAHRIKWMVTNTRHEDIVKVTAMSSGTYKIDKKK